MPHRRDTTIRSAPRTRVHVKITWEMGSNIRLDIDTSQLYA